MGTLGNVLWFIFGGLFSGMGWVLAGILWSITIVGIPIGQQCFKIAGLTFFPFGKEIVYNGSSLSIIVDIIWLLISGIPLAISHVISGVIFCVTIVGIPFGLQCFKLARLALMPFGAEVVQK